MRTAPRAMRLAHPRSRGENMTVKLNSSVNQGSSPLTRGKLRGHHARPETPGLIPAHAGKTSARSASVHTATAHPRSRGENSEARIHTRSFEGSSPLTRGKLRRIGIIAACRGLIPAHAGKTVRARKFDLVLRAHPRSRGENRSPNPNPTTATGSSPLTRGKLGISGGRFKNHGLIPAHAGKTAHHRRPDWRARAHPRSRGENRFYLPRPKRPRGSSPLTRGKPGDGQDAGVSRGLIPAHAGKTLGFARLP